MHELKYAYIERESCQLHQNIEAGAEVLAKRSTDQCKCDEHTFVNRTLSIFIEHQSCAEQYYSCKALYNWELDNIPT